MKSKEALQLMGQKVVVNKLLIRDEDFIKSKAAFPSKRRIRWLEHETCPRTGWIMGFRTVQDGFIIPDEFGNIFKITDTHRCAKVVFWPLENPVHVPLDGYKIADENAPKPYPTCGGWRDGNADTHKAELSNIMRDERKDWPRDEKGRWKKG